MYTNIKKWGNSSAVRIPKSILSVSEFCEKDDIYISAKPGEIVIKKAHQDHTPLRERMKDYKGSYESEEISITPIGEEVFW